MTGGHEDTAGGAACRADRWMLSPLSPLVKTPWSRLMTRSQRLLTLDVLHFCAALHTMTLLLEHNLLDLVSITAPSLFPAYLHTWRPHAVRTSEVV